MANGEAQSESQSGKDATPPKGSSAKRMILILLVIMVLVGIGLYMFFNRNKIDTDDAYTTGRKISIAAHVSGYISHLMVDDNQFVHQGDLLVQIDGRDYLAQLHRAEASVQQAEADITAYNVLSAVARKNFPGQLLIAQGSLSAAKARLFRAQRDYERQRRVDRAATTQQNIDTTRAALDEATAAVVQAQGQLLQAEPVHDNIANADARVTQADASLKAARADLEAARNNVEWMDIRAPHDGWISQRNVEQGTFVQTGQEMFSIVTPDIWIVANYKETQLSRMRPGQKAEIEVDAYPQLHLKGHVDSIQKGSGESFSAFPPENATGNFVKTVQRIPVKILIDEGLDPHYPLSLGMSVEPTVNVQ
ncbi:MULTISPECIES: HlyD family secretion protein [unclassified Saccharibacter]|uniref:HlyD family secretion protein n=1 Tax=unclassified Saccharibacter TaxID=2648722 RepID=UPI001326440A|nr:HlyD family efflux transporter periplasmic adaptor subunit [Saccharibacter sp. EH611]MXV57298.1 HlyD family efflux transporter periplasmic adaptor subunit [Saccharibacter sp. EH70]MXV64841.1 HlyD family efflux transporter periplasmic adaptor subunit [Saccharibacter sp. EH60]